MEAGVSPDLAAPSAGGPVSLRLLVVDDDDDVRCSVQALLSDFGHLVETAGDGAAAWSRMSDPQARFDAVIADLSMPGLSGFDLLRKARESSLDVPIAIITGCAERDATVEALRLEAFDFLLKPVSSDQFQALIERVEVRRRVGGSSLGEAPASGSRFEIELKSRPEMIAAGVRRALHYAAPVLQAGGLSANGFRICLMEALSNAVFHGNLELNSSLRDRDWEAYEALKDRRANDPQYCERPVTLSIEAKADELVVEVADAGAGFDKTLVDEDPHDPARHCHGRGLFLIRNFASDARWLAPGNRVRMSFRAPQPAPVHP